VCPLEPQGGGVTYFAPPPPLPDGSPAEAPAEAPFGQPRPAEAPSEAEPPAKDLFFHVAPNKVYEEFSEEDVDLIIAAEKRGAKSVRISDVVLPNGVVLRFEVRFGDNATSSKWPKPSESGYVQVNIGNDNTRFVDRLSPQDVARKAKEGIVFKRR
jgi:hypothetical protein